MLNQGMSVFRPAGSRRKPSLAVWSAAVCEPHSTETAVMRTLGATVRVWVESDELAKSGVPL